MFDFPNIEFSTRRPSGRAGARSLQIMLGIAASCLSGTLSFAVESPDVTAPPTSFIRATGAPPPGFEDFTRAQTTEADIFFGGEYLLSTLITYDLSEVTIEDPSVIIDAIPTIKRPELIEAALGIALPSHAQKVCHKRAKPDCGALAPEVVGLIFNEGLFRVDIFLHPDQLITQTPTLQRYLPAPEAGLSLLHDVNFTASGRGSDNQINLTSETLLSHEALRLSARYGLSNTGLSLFETSLQWDEQDREFEIGSFRAIGRSSAFIGDLDLLGFSVGSSTNTRTDLENALGTPLFVFLSQRARVDVLRNGELIDSRFYPAGNQQLDTANLPDGAYQLTLRIVENDGSERTQTQFFVRNSRLPPQGETQYRAEIGVLTNTQGNQTPSITNVPLVRAGITTRLSQAIALEGELTHVNDLNFATAGVFYFAPGWQLHAGFLASDEGDFGYSLRGTRSGPKASWSFDYTQVDAAEIRTGGSASFADQLLEIDPFFNSSLLPDSFSQGSTSFAFPLFGGRGIVRARINKRRGVSTDQAIGFSYLRPLFQRGLVTADLNLDTSLSDQNSFARLAINFRLRRANSFGTLTPQFQYTSNTGRNPAEGRLNASWTRNHQSELFGATQSGAFLQHEPQRTVLGARLQNQSQYGISSAEISYENGDVAKGINYSATSRFSVVTKAGATALGGGERNLAAVVVEIDAKSPDSKFNIVVDNRVVGQASPTNRGLVSLRPYDTYDVQIRPLGNKILNYDESVRRITLFPGNVHSLSFDAHPVTVVVGQALFADGTPVASGRVTNVDAFAATDEAGWFQLELTKPQRIVIRHAPGESCSFDLATFPDPDLSVIEPVICQPVNN